MKYSWVICTTFLESSKIWWTLSILKLQIFVEGNPLIIIFALIFKVKYCVSNSFSS
jgi:hypothetical protein